MVATFTVAAGIWACTGDSGEKPAPETSASETSALETSISEKPAPEPSISPAELADRIAAESAPIVLDVRTPQEFAAGHIPGAVNIPHTELASRLSTLDFDPDQEIVVHCEQGGRASIAESILREGGYTRVRDLTGHMKAWRAGGYPVR